MDRNTASYVRDILIEEMPIASDRIWVSNQNIIIPKDDELFIVVGVVDTQVISNRNNPYEEDGLLKESLTVITRDNVQIDMYSGNNDALTRRWEIPAAINSIFSIQTQEKNFFKIAKTPTSFLNTSETEGAQQINKFTSIYPVTAWYQKNKAISTANGDYYETFDTRVDDDNTIETTVGLIEFTITGE